MVNANQVKELREKTGAGMMDCKKALTECNGDIELSVEWLRKRGLSAAAKKAGRIAAEGLTALAVKGNTAVAIEMNSETDFVSRNDKFQSLVSDVVSAALECDNLEDLLSHTLKSGMKVSDAVTDAVAVIGENITLRRVSKVSINSGAIGSYVHNSVKDGMGKISVLVAIESESDIQDLAKQIAMHIAASKPLYLSIDDVNKEVLEREKSIYRDQAMAQAKDKPANIIDKMVEGRVRKFYEEAVLLEQIFVIDGKTKISDLLKNAKIKSFVRYELGEGIEQQKSDFAAEVAAMASK